MLDLSSLSERAGLGVELAGVIGYPVFSKSDIEIKYSETQDRIWLYDPQAYELGNGQWQALKIKTDKPLISARCEGNHEGEFLLDTGKGGNVCFYTNFIEEQNFLENRTVTKMKNKK